MCAAWLVNVRAARPVSGRVVVIQSVLNGCNWQAGPESAHPSERPRCPVTGYILLAICRGDPSDRDTPPVTQRQWCSTVGLWVGRQMCLVVTLLCRP